MAHPALPAGPRLYQRGCERSLARAVSRAAGCASRKNCGPESRNQEMTVSQQEKAQAVQRAARLLGRGDEAARQALGSLWDEAFDAGRLAALDELQDRFCVCMK
jgi:hypothetical protein